MDILILSSQENESGRNGVDSAIAEFHSYDRQRWDDPTDFGKYVE